MKFISANVFSFFSVVKTLSRLIPAMTGSKREGTLFQLDL